jgi:hypothetical protein
MTKASATKRAKIALGELAATTKNKRPEAATQDQVWVEKFALPMPAARATEKTNQGIATIATTEAIRPCSCAKESAGQSENINPPKMRAKLDSVAKEVSFQAPATARAFASKRMIAKASDGAQNVKAARVVSTQTNGSLGAK